ncbi:hypothetical protein FHW83_005830 [Duganella sp. SG902]|uniref:hypothetical protein n=1 Tax=Duganella sp. SG902 TaxID=2587016 RepID=UPI00159E8FD3|nr:hypothetical protein [Duganella sp. SG902]NVM79988.1 hypothetical protein [Duganella sp. SG902]
MNAATRQLLLQLLRDRASCGMLVRLSWLVGGFAVIQLVVNYHFGKPDFGKLVLLWLIGGMCYLWCGAFLKNAVQQNTPANAVLVPGLRRKLMRLTVLLYAGATLLTGALSGLLTGRPGYGLLVGALFSIYVLYAQRYNWLNFLPSVVIVGSLWVSNHPVEQVLSAADAVGEPLLTSFGMTLLALLARPALQALFPQGGDRHWAWYLRFTRQLAVASGSVLNTEPAHGVPGLAWLRAPYNAALRADSRRGVNRGRQMLHTLGTPAHDGGAIVYAVISALIMIMVGRSLAAKGDAVFTMVSSTMMQGMLMMSVVIYASTVVTHAVRRGGEQGLYRLTPAAPASNQFNRVLLGALLFRCLRLWLICLLAISCIDAVILGQPQVRGITFALATLMLPFTLLLMRDYASAPPRPNAVLMVVTVTLVMAAYIALAMVDQAHPDLPLFWFGGGVALVTAIVMRLRWQQLVALPPLLPACRAAV